MPIKTVHGLSHPIDTSINETWQAAPVQEGNTHTRETLHRTPDGEWILHRLTRYWPIKPGRGVIGDSWQVYNAQHAVGFPGENAQISHMFHICSDYPGKPDSGGRGGVCHLSWDPPRF